MGAALIPAGVNKAGEKKNAPAPPDYMALVDKQAAASQQAVDRQTQANRPNQSTDNASSSWSQSPDGKWSQQLRLNGPLGDANKALQGQAASALSTPLDYSGLQSLNTGADARDQAITSAYGQATSRLDPRFAQQEDALRTRLLNQGLAEGSQAYNQAFGQFGRDKNDAYSSAMNGAIGQGTSAGSAIFNQSLAGRQQGMSELLRQRQQPLSELQQMQGLTNMPGVAQAGRGETPNYFGAGQQLHEDEVRKWATEQGMTTDMINGLVNIAMQGGMLAASDERAKMELTRHPFEVLPGVPLASWRYRPEFGLADGLHWGVVAQDLQNVAPQYVHERADGLLMVDYSFLGVQ